MFKSDNSQEVEIQYQMAKEQVYIYIAQAMAISGPAHFSDCEILLSDVMKNAKKVSVPKEFKVQRKVLLMEASGRLGKRLKLKWNIWHNI